MSDEKPLLHPFGVPRFVGKEDDNKQRRIFPNKDGKDKHKVEEDKTSDSTKPPTKKEKK